jgi:hypothetical protein
VFVCRRGLIVPRQVGVLLRLGGIGIGQTGSSRCGGRGNRGGRGIGTAPRARQPAMGFLSR